MESARHGLVKVTVLIISVSNVLYYDITNRLGMLFTGDYRGRMNNYCYIFLNQIQCVLNQFMFPFL